MNPENKNISNNQPFNRITNKLYNHLTNAVFYLAILFFIIGFNFSDRMAGNWYQQFMPDLGGRTIVDMTFTDSLTGYAITNSLSLQDTSFILRTTNRGDSWYFTYADSGVTYTCIQFINQITGFVGGRINKSNLFKFVKTTNSGINWFYINAPFDNVVKDIFALNEDTIWLADNGFGGGVFFTSNGGLNWTRQSTPPGLNPDHIYMYNSRIGFAGQFSGAPRLLKTTNSGLNWFSLNDTGFTDMYFSDSLTGWMSMGWMKKTTNGGLNWELQVIPEGLNVNTGISKFSNINKDTIWAVGGYKFYPGNGIRGILYRTTNQGVNWLYQIPDTSFHLPTYFYPQFLNKFTGWAYSTIIGGIHTTNGGDTTFILPVNQISAQVPNEYKLFQNYPNPFNPKTIIRFQIYRLSYLKLSVYDIQGKQIAELVNGKYSAGIYETDWNAAGFASGIYFYSLIIDNNLVDTKKMILLK